MHIYVLRDGMEQEEWDAKITRAMDLLYEKGQELGGMVSGEHGIGVAKRTYMEKSLSAGEIRLMAEVKRVFDPEGILNPGKVVE